MLAKNASLPDYDGVARDWIELYNASGSSVNLADLSLSNDPLLPRRWVFPAGITLASGAYRVVCFSADEPASTNHAARLNTGFGINANLTLLDTEFTFLTSRGPRTTGLFQQHKRPAFSQVSPSMRVNWPPMSRVAAMPTHC